MKQLTIEKIIQIQNTEIANSPILNPRGQCAEGDSKILLKQVRKYLEKT